MVGLAPSDVDGLDWFAGMAEQNVSEYSAASLGHHAVATRLELLAQRIRADPKSMITSLYADLTGSDRIVLADMGIRRMLLSNYAEGLRLSAAGWIDDVIALTLAMGIRSGRHRGADPVVARHGGPDSRCSFGHGAWLGDRIPGAISIIDPGRSHFDARDLLPRAVAWLASG